MSTIDRGPAVAVPPLVAGERLDAETFRERLRGDAAVHPRRAD